ncbi:disintegrin and metalloproteinase domain-containing protein 8 [Macrotis lagotis]|uniref:disintegrin and metalloproteinase domain-containing protein 8 n=1 Tax=Macrotis lagotis TaxID=92651 RepID=UPI003D691E88
MCAPCRGLGGLVLLLLGGLPGLSDPLPHVEQYEVVYPVRLPVARTRRDISSPQMLYPENLRYVLGVKGSNFILHLRRNRDLIGSGYTETYTLTNGTEVTEQPGDLQDHCFYQGHVEGHQNSAASISICHGIRGFFQTDSSVHLIEPLEGEGRHAVYRAEHLIQKLVTCGVSNTTLEGDLEPRMSAAQKPQNWKSRTVSKEMRYVELFVVVDHVEYVKLGSREAVQIRVKEIVNHVDKLYQELNFRVVLIGLEIWDRWDKIQISSSPESTLHNFLLWRDQELVHRKKHDNAQLITGVDFEGTTVGLARVASMCSLASGAVNQDHHRNPIGVASTLAHEMGHNLGMDHDENVPGCYCHAHKNDGGCIMAAQLSTIFPKTFSFCSRNNLDKFVESDIFQAGCLDNPPQLDEIYGGPVCGNRFVERGEECDCGGPEECENRCCNATTCRLATGAGCAHGECCHECQVIPVGQICRKAQDDCDLPEYCDGQRGECPENVFQENGAPCRNGYCYNGICPTYQQQCQALWGQGASVAADECFRLESCSQWSTFNKCGVLHCNGGTVTQRSSCTITWGRTKCTLTRKESANEPFEMVATGTKCGEQMVCYNGNCQDLRVYGDKNCSSQCNGHGVCNHKRQCHCHPGWAPPYCQQKAPDFGNSGNQGILIGVLVAVALLIILIGLAFILWKCIKLPPFQKRKIAAETPSGLSNPLFQAGDRREPRPVSAPVAAQIPKPHSAPPAPPVAAGPQRVPVYTRQAPQQTKPAPPSKPLPELKSKQVVKPTSTPPPPPVKPPAGIALKPQGAGPKVALMPPGHRR